ncbi:hypothetical protein A3G55_02695 [Candidatus Giovannonibacteria bacterium RIFCSPLOWO2_12_FULL_44_25]|uniref:Uncharacterized protein n=3 Tax=Candidatus Giovannoniibacteriota TaxID=1752738 RepID=A0A0G1LAR9_9BACT|nr:MAG: hypothetical protein UW15_C0014G0003 [Parcubacteria group bacterium GW2011_GWC1_44_10]KKT57059.1 MAG: hypothetical protein UW49_C0008G0021 [Candidatus Giovannonibacteria bacterium GW2011_GWB1_44_23]KKT59496.1 MAG: hypothetical protein UW53_C0011G0025 [Candidatus Giovannonibacteria bacterium GW2011_GWA1_44_25]OGF49945.1 MAG: hypothetical protein A2120_04520 [Candidatus Giovannonibacteria bacterium GWA2_45_15]OGF60579.1 MAG: hypothetical protein A2656_00680 [Candidatus Giovannonibacteria 
MALKLDDRKIKLLVKEGVKEAMDSQFMKLSALLLPHVSPKEQKEIVRLYGRPSRRVAKSYIIKA